MSSSQDFIDKLYDKLDKYLKTETVIGEPIQAGEVTLIPIISASFGIGGGMGISKRDNDQGDEGGGGGLGCRITPTAILVVKNDEVELVNLEGKGSLEKLVDMVPGIMEKIKNQKEDSNEEEKSVEKE